MKENNGRIDSRALMSCFGVMMDFPERTRIKVEELADKFTDITGECFDFPQVVLTCIDFVYSLVEGGDEE